MKPMFIAALFTKKMWYIYIMEYYFGHLMERTDLLKKTLMLGKIEGRTEGDN